MLFIYFIGKSKFSRTSNVLESFEKYLASTNIHLHFDEIAEIPASRALKQQLRLIHKESGIQVLLLVDDIAVTEVPKIIRDFIAIKPICEQISFNIIHLKHLNNFKPSLKCFYSYIRLGRNMIEYVLAWQNALNGILAQNEAGGFQFNAYIISVLVIFFMQVNYDIPAISDIGTIKSNPDALKKASASLKKDMTNIDKMLADFFWFYGQRYQIWNHVISLNIGRWQERRIQDQQKHFLPNQKRYVDFYGKLYGKENRLGRNPILNIFSMNFYYIDFEMASLEILQIGKIVQCTLKTCYGLA